MGITKDLHLLLKDFQRKSPRAQLAAHHPWLCVESYRSVCRLPFLESSQPLFCGWPTYSRPISFFRMIGLGGHNFFLCFLDLRKLDARKKRQQNTLPTGGGKMEMNPMVPSLYKKNQIKKLPGTQNDDPAVFCVEWRFLGSSSCGGFTNSPQKIEGHIRRLQR